jgi:hypothetical protein
VIEEHLRNGLDKKKDLDHELGSQGGQCCTSSAALPHPKSGTATLSVFMISFLFLSKSITQSFFLITTQSQSIQFTRKTHKALQWME